MYEEEKQYIHIEELRFNSLTKSLKQHCISSDRNAARDEKDRQRGDKCMNLNLILTNIHSPYKEHASYESKKENLEHALYRKFETYNPRNETVHPRFQFLHSSILERFIYSHD